MNVIETIRAEIERLKKETIPQKGQGIVLTQELRKSYDHLLSFLDTLKEQFVCDGLEEEIERVYAEDKFTTRTRASYSILARHFAQWMREKMLKEAVEGKIYGDIKELEDEPYEIWAESYSLPKDKFRLHEDVKLIIIKEETK